jgi:hypothetical protein
MAGVGVEEDDGCHLDGHAVAKTRVMFVVSKSQGRVETHSIFQKISSFLEFRLKSIA